MSCLGPFLDPSATRVKDNLLIWPLSKMPALKGGLESFFGKSHRKIRVSLVMQNNTEASIVEKTRAAFEIYEENSSESNAESIPLSARYIAALNKLAELDGLCHERGITHWHPTENQREDGTLSTPCGGPTFTPLLLSVHDKDNVLHFGYEVYSWLCFNDRLPQPKSFPYEQEYENLVTRFNELRERLGGVISALDVERVAHFLMRENKGKEASDWLASRERKGLDVSKNVQRLKDEAAAFMGQGFDTEETERKVETGDDVAMDGGLRRTKRRKFVR